MSKTLAVVAEVQPEVSLALEPVSPGQLRHLAFSRRGDVVFRHLLGVPPPAWPQAHPEVLAEGLWGALGELDRLTSQPLAQSAAVLAHARALWRALDGSCERLRSWPEDYFRAARGWARWLLGQRDFGGALGVGRQALGRGSARFPAEHVALQLLVSDSLWELGEVAEAHALLAEMARRPYLWPGRDDGLDVEWRLGRLSLQQGNPSALEASARAVLLAPKVDEARRRDAVKQLARLHGGYLRPLWTPAARQGQWLPYAAWLAHFGLQRARGPARLAAVSRAAGRGASALGAAGTRLARRLARPGPRVDGVLVTRAMGGVGDLLMMTPGLRALSQRQPAPVTFAVPAPFLPLFAGNPDVVAVDIAGPPLDPRGFRRWFDLTRCPASVVESRTAPWVKQNRIELFAAGLGVGPRELDRAGRRPRYVVLEAERQAAREQLAPLRRLRRKVVGVQLQAADSYRDYPLMPVLVARLAEAHGVVVFHGSPLEGFELPGVLRCDRFTLRQSAALLEQCDAFVGPDSSFLHFAAAFDLPSVLVAGPVDGLLRASDYPRCEVVDARAELGCIPCWRHERSDCLAGGTRVSVCMASVPVERVLARVLAALG